jgi:hypothetical protein
MIAGPGDARRRRITQESGPTLSTAPTLPSAAGAGAGREVRPSAALAKAAVHRGLAGTAALHVLGGRARRAAAAVDRLRTPPSSRQALAVSHDAPVLLAPLARRARRARRPGQTRATARRGSARSDGCAGTVRAAAACSTAAAARPSGTAASAAGVAGCTGARAGAAPPCGNASTTRPTAGMARRICAGGRAARADREPAARPAPRLAIRGRAVVRAAATSKRDRKRNEKEHPSHAPPLQRICWGAHPRRMSTFPAAKREHVHGQTRIFDGEVGLS